MCTRLCSHGGEEKRPAEWGKKMGNPGRDQTTPKEATTAKGKILPLRRAWTRSQLPVLTTPGKRGADSAGLNRLVGGISSNR